MAVEFTAEDFSKQLHHDIASMTLTGKLEIEDYDSFVPRMERFVHKHKGAGLVIHLTDFNGWNTGALWENTQFEGRHYDNVSRIAVVGDRFWQKGLSSFLKAFPKADVRYFDTALKEDALKWLTRRQPGKAGAPEPAGTAG